jgi:hypothetical protein
MSTNPTPAEITKAQAIVEFAAAQEAALAAAANLIEVANAMQREVARGHFNLEAYGLTDAAQWHVDACERASAARHNLWEIQAAEKRAAATAERAAYVADTKADAKAAKAAKSRPDK